ncbi:MAG: calcium-binding protein [Steroidobacteraceae bacterium]
MRRPKINRVRERRIEQQIVVDACGPDERALSWYYYLENQLRFPFEAICHTRRATSPLNIGDSVTITGLAPDDDCGGEIIVLTRWHERPLGVPLTQLAPQQVDPGTAEAIADWQYWTAMGYRF